MSHWSHHARQWALLGPPLRPSEEDVAFVAPLVANARRVVILGVTPELAVLPRRTDAELVAIDREPAMIEAIFPGGGRAVVGDWLAMPFADRSIDLAIGDGCLTNLAYPDTYRTFADELARVVEPGGLLALRLFATPERPETLDDIARDLRAGNIGGMHALKWRLAMAVQPADRNVPVAAILRAFDATISDRDSLPWPRAICDTIEAYRGSALVYSFPTIDEVRAIMGSRFDEVALHTPSYELGARCPTIVLQRSS